MGTTSRNLCYDDIFLAVSNLKADEVGHILLVCKMNSSSSFYNLPSPSSRERVQWRRGCSSEYVSLASPTHWSVISLRFVRVRICGLGRRFDTSVTSPGCVLIHPWCCLWCWRSRRISECNFFLSVAPFCQSWLGSMISTKWFVLNARLYKILSWVSK